MKTLNLFRIDTETLTRKAKRAVSKSKTRSVGVPIKEILKHESWSQERTLEKL